MFDIVIRGGTIVDGTGAEPYSGDVAIKDGVIVVLSALSRCTWFRSRTHDSK